MLTKFISQAWSHIIVLDVCRLMFVNYGKLRYDVLSKNTLVSLYVSYCVCVCMCVCISVFVCVYMQMCVWVHVQVCTYIDLCTCVWCIYICMCVLTPLMSVLAYMYIPMQLFRLMSILTVHNNKHCSCIAILCSLTFQ